MVKPTNRISIWSSCQLVGRYQMPRKNGVKKDLDRRYCLRRVQGPDQGKNQHVLCRRQPDHSRRDFVALEEAAS
jgi:hypothetical protein